MLNEGYIPIGFPPTFIVFIPPEYSVLARGTDKHGRMEHAVRWSLLKEWEEDAPVSGPVAVQIACVLVEGDRHGRPGYRPFPIYTQPLPKLVKLRNIEAGSVPHMEVPRHSDFTFCLIEASALDFSGEAAILAGPGAIPTI
jgi:hypothetical protein